jgi:3-oxoadipate enol-lactonase
MASVESGYADVEGASLYYKLVGTGPTLVLLHGFSFDTTLWDGQIDSFSAKFRVLRYDLRGFGRSKSSNVPYSHAGDLKALLDHLKIVRAHLVGLSLGGGASINFALMFPGIAQTLILVAPSLGGFRWSSNVGAAQSSMQAKIREKGLEAAREIWMRQTIFRHAMNNKVVAGKLRQMVGSYSGWHWMHSDLGKPMTPPAIERLSEIRTPTLVLVGDADAADQLQIADTLERGITGARKIVYPGVGHLINMEEPELFNTAVLKFLEDAGKQ